MTREPDAGSGLRPKKLDKTRNADSHGDRTERDQIDKRHNQGDRKVNKTQRPDRLQQETLMTRQTDETRNRLDTKGN